jgi:circadian clock protein KaiC
MREMMPYPSALPGDSMKRFKTGIAGFDRMLYGGIPKGAVIMISGSAGAGKTIFALQSLCEGAANGEKGLYITFEQDPKDVIEQGQLFKWDVDGLVKKGTLKVIRMTYPKIKDNGAKAFEKVLDEWKLPVSMRDEIIGAIRAFDPKRVVIDSLSTMGSTMRSNVADMMKRDIIMELIMALKRENLEFAIVTSELPRTGDWYSNDGISEYLVDGIVVMHKISTGMGTSRMISVEKMRKTNHRIEKFPMSIEDGVGITVKFKETP